MALMVVRAGPGIRELHRGLGDPLARLLLELGSPGLGVRAGLFIVVSVWYVREHYCSMEGTR
jgi:hypothetical protein